MLAKIGYEILDPWVLTDQAVIDKALKAPYGPIQRSLWQEANRIIGANNAKSSISSTIAMARSSVPWSFGSQSCADGMAN